MKGLITQAMIGLLLLSSCTSVKSRQDNINSNDTTVLCGGMQADTSLSFDNAKHFDSKCTRVFYSITNDTIYIYHTYKIIDNTIVENELDMDYYTYHISEINVTNDTIAMSFNTSDFNYEEDFFVISKTHLIRDKKYQWKVFFNNNFNEPYKYTLIDSMDIVKSGYFVDKTNYWLEN